MRPIRILVIAFIALSFAVIVILFVLNRYVQSSAFKQTALTVARNAIGSEVKIDQINVSLFRGITLRGVAIMNPPGFPGELLKAESVVLRYRLIPLLHKRVEIQKLSLQRPVITLARNQKNEWNYQKLGKQSAQSSSGFVPATTAPTAPMRSAIGARSGTTFDIALSKLVIRGGEMVMASENKKPLTRFQNMDFVGSVNLAGHTLTGTGTVSIETLSVANALFLRRLSAPISFEAGRVELSPVCGQLADGDVSGELTVNLSGGLKFLFNLNVKNSQVDKLLREAGAKRLMNGRLQATAQIEGTGAIASLVGHGRASIDGGKLTNLPLLNLLARLLQMPSLRDLPLDECLVEFTLGNNVMQTPVIRIVSPQMQITGKGAVSLADYTLNHDMTLAVAKEILDQAPKEIRGVFTRRPDGFLGIDFHVSGPFTSPKTDLAERLVKGAAEQFLEKEFQKGFEKILK